MRNNDTATDIVADAAHSTDATAATDAADAAMTPVSRAALLRWVLQQELASEAVQLARIQLSQGIDLRDGKSGDERLFEAQERLEATRAEMCSLALPTGCTDRPALELQERQEPDQGFPETALLSPNSTLSLPPVTVTGLLAPDWGRCDYCGEKQQHRHFLVTSTDYEGEAKACVECKVTDLPLPVVVWAREQDIAHIKWQKVDEAQAADGEDGFEDAFLVGDIKLAPVMASRPADKPRQEEHQRRYYAGWSRGPFDKRNVVYWYELV